MKKELQNTRKTKSLDGILRAHRDDFIAVNLATMGVKIEIIIPKESSDTFESSYRNLIPDPKRIDDTKIDMSITVFKTDKGFLKIKENEIVIGSEGDYRQIATDAILAASKFLELELNKNSTFSAHAAGICTAEECVLFIGHSGSGKTTTAIASCIANSNMSFVDNIS